jgi:hypothetical protein
MPTLCALAMTHDDHRAADNRFATTAHPAPTRGSESWRAQPQRSGVEYVTEASGGTSSLGPYAQNRDHCIGYVQNRGGFSALLPSGRRARLPPGRSGGNPQVHNSISQSNRGSVRPEQ